jgi:hypothetical protein
MKILICIILGGFIGFVVGSIIAGNYENPNPNFVGGLTLVGAFIGIFVGNED